MKEHLQFLWTLTLPHTTEPPYWPYPCWLKLLDNYVPYPNVKGCLRMLSSVCCLHKKVTCIKEWMASRSFCRLPMRGQQQWCEERLSCQILFTTHLYSCPLTFFKSTAMPIFQVSSLLLQIQCRIIFGRHGSLIEYPKYFQTFTICQCHTIVLAMLNAFECLGDIDKRMCA